MATVQEVFRSRWGFHPCDYTTYRKLKFLNLAHQKAVRLARAWQRWKRKDPHNRVSRCRIRNESGQTVGYGPPVPLAEPALCPLFSRKVNEKRYVDRRGLCHPDGILDEAVVTDDRGIPAAYAAARRPVSHPAEVSSLRHSVGDIDALYQEARAWVERQDVG
jgi:hypothetical protein